MSTSTSRVNFKSMFLISETYFNELKDKQKEDNVTEESLEPSVPTPPTAALVPPVSPHPTPVVAAIPEPEPETEPEPEPEPTSTSLSEDEWTPNQETVNKKDGEYKSIVDKINSFNCPVCNEAFVTEADMLAHQTRNHPVHECKLCKREFKSKKELDNHITESHERGRQSNSSMSMNRSSKRLANKRARDDEDETNDYNNDKLLKRRKIKVSRRENKRSREQNEEEVKPTTVKKVKVQLQNIDDIKDIRQKERKEINNSIGEQHKVETITYPGPGAGTKTCPICQKEFNSLYEYRDHQMLH